MDKRGKGECTGGRSRSLIRNRMLLQHGVADAAAVTAVPRNENEARFRRNRLLSSCSDNNFVLLETRRTQFKAMLEMSSSRQGNRDRKVLFDLTVFPTRSSVPNSKVPICS